VSAFLRLKGPCILIRLNRACDEFVVTGNLRFVTMSRAQFQTGRNEPSKPADRELNWLDARTCLEPELSDDGCDAFVFNRPAEAGSFLHHFAGGTRAMDWVARPPGSFRRGEFVDGAFTSAFHDFLRNTGAGGPQAPTPEQIWAAYRTLIRAGLAEDLPDAEWIRQRVGARV
jgi:hypothetical protein